MVREMRAESRRPFSYWLRVLGVAAVLVACFSAVRTQEVIEINLAMSGLPASQWPPFASRPPLPDPAQVLGSLLFGNVNAALFVALWVLVPLLASDCISREKREGTLGLLFLTPLAAWEVVTGKSRCIRAATEVTRKVCGAVRM